MVVFLGVLMLLMVVYLWFIRGFDDIEVVLLGSRERGTGSGATHSRFFAFLLLIYCLLLDMEK